MHWNFQSVKCMDKYVEQADRRKTRIQKNEHVCRLERIFLVSDSTARPYLKLAGPTRTDQSSSKL